MRTGIANTARPLAAAAPSAIRSFVLAVLLLACAAGLATLAPAAPTAEQTPLHQLAPLAPQQASAAEPIAAQALSDLYDTNITDANQHQLVLVVRFAGDATGDGGTGLNEVPAGSTLTRWQSVYHSLNGKPLTKYASPSLYSYLKEVSAGQCRIQSIVPQMSADGATVTYLTLPGSRSSYTTSSSLVAAAVAAFNTAYPRADLSDLADTAEGYISNVLVIPETGNDTPAVGSALWPHQDDYPGDLRVGATGASARVGSYTVIDTTHVLYTGTIVHEAIHAFGGKDLYRTTSLQLSNQPVGMWDVMAMNSASRLMRPLYITLQDCGWASIDEVGPGTYTLHAPNTSGRSAVKFKSPYSDSEYFVAEFRVANTDIGNLSALDTASDSFSYTIGGTGLIVYRVNPAAKTTGNKGDKDYVYLFRQGETTASGPRGDGAGDLKHAQLSATGTSTLGSLDPKAGLGDGAITLSDGSNAGLKAQVTSSGTSSLTFSLTVAEEAGGWEKAAATGAALPTSGYYETRLVEDGGALYQLCTAHLGAPRVFCLKEASRTDLGAPSQNFSSFYTCDMTVSNGAVYLAASDGARTIVWTRSASPQAASSWAKVGEVPLGATEPALGATGSGVYLFVDNLGNGGALYRVGTGGLTAEGGTLPSGSVYHPRIIERNGAPAIVFSTDSETRMAWRDGTSWRSVVLHAGVSSSIDTALSGGVTYVASSSNQKVHLSAIAANGSFVATDITSHVPAPFGVALAARNSTLYLGVMESGTQVARVYQASATNLGRWTPLGDAVVSSATSASLAVAGSRLFCATIDSVDAPVGLRSFALSADVGNAGSSGNSGDGSSAGSSTGETAGAWVKSGGRWWYRHADGSYTRSGWERIGGAWYHFDKAGWMQTGWLKTGGTWYYLAQSGAMRTGWLKAGQTWYYLKGSGVMAVGWHKVAGSWYWFASSGAMGSSRWVGNYYLKSSGAMATSQWIGRYHVDADGRWDKTR